MRTIAPAELFPEPTAGRDLPDSTKAYIAWQRHTNAELEAALRRRGYQSIEDMRALAMQGRLTGTIAPLREEYYLDGEHLVTCTYLLDEDTLPEPASEYPALPGEAIPSHRRQLREASDDPGTLDHRPAKSDEQ